MADDVRSVRPNSDDGIQLAREDHDKESAEELIAEISNFHILQGDALELLRALPDESVNCCITSPPYWGLRDYGCAGQIGLERTPEEYIARLVEVFREVRRVLKADGTLWVNIGDSYANDGKWGGSSRGKHVEALHGNTGIGRGRRDTGLKPKDLVGIPWMLAFALRDDGWWLRQDIIWHKPNPMPESVKDRCTKAHEYVFLLTKNARYHYDGDSISGPPSPSSFARLGQDLEHQAGSLRVPGKTNGPMKAVFGGRNKHAGYGTRIHSGNEDSGGYLKSGVNKRSVWTLATLPTPEAHFATFPLELPEICLRAGCPEGGHVLDPFAGAGTTGIACLKNGRRFLGLELNPAYIEIAHSRARKYYPLLMEVTA